MSPSAPPDPIAMRTAAPGAPLVPRTARIGDAFISYLEAGRGDPPLVLLHGIGSRAASWRHQLAGLSDRLRVIAWDAPGYGESSDLAAPAPTAGDYAACLASFLDALGAGRLHLVGHSLGALMAARFAADHPERIASLTLASVASGHARLAEAERARLLAGRLDDLARLGPAGMAEKR
jgi:pimeloyl-ACP methyl ester carboxylesterase